MSDDFKPKEASFKIGGQHGPWMMPHPTTEIIRNEVNIEQFRKRFPTPELRLYYYNYLRYFLRLPLEDLYKFQALTSDCSECFDVGLVPPFKCEIPQEKCICKQ